MHSIFAAARSVVPAQQLDIFELRMLPAGLDAALAPGTVIGGKYRVEQPIGTGGMGVVVAARHLELNQNLAIKVLLPTAANNDEAITRFLREGRSAAQLTSPHVAKVHDSGRLPSGAPYLVMELLHGKDLRAHLADVRRVPLAQAVEWVLQAAHALAEAHARNIIHRDVKPANLFLAETSTGHQIKVLDFGVSKQLDSDEKDLTKTTSAVGTPKYMAPEQMRSARFADARGDVWSLGIVLYELTTGQSPFHGDSVTALCFDIMERTPAPPSQVNPVLPHAFDEVLARCLEKDPDERFQSMAALANALRAIAPGSRSSELLNTPSLQPAGVPGATPIPIGSTPNPLAQAPDGSPATTLPAAQPLFPELPPQETLRTWNTPALPRPATKKEQRRVPLVALGIGIGLAAAMLFGTCFDRRESTSPAQQPAVVPSSTASDTTAPKTTASAIPSPPTAEPVVELADPPVPSGAASVLAPPPPPPPPPPPCKPPWTIKNGIKVPKPYCL